MGKKSVAIVGAGPGGLLTAYYLQKYGQSHGGGELDVCLFEATARSGGKVLTPHMPKTRIQHEAGVAEIYDYSQLGPDPLKNLIRDLGLTVTSLDGQAVVFEGKLLKTNATVAAHLGPASSATLAKFKRHARDAFSPQDFYFSDSANDRQERLMTGTFADLLDEVGDERVRRYIEVVVHSDLAAEPHQTSAAYGLQNWLMNETDYMQMYSVDGGNEGLVRALASRLAYPMHLNTAVTCVSVCDDGRYELTLKNDANQSTKTFDVVILAMPVGSLSQLNFQGQNLARAMRQHIRHYDHPAHYLRITVAFRNAFWRGKVKGSYFMIEAFGGACIYDESSRHGKNAEPVLSWLLAGDAALLLANANDADLLVTALGSLPLELGAKGQEVLEYKVYRWVGSVNAWPLGKTIADIDSRHMPDPIHHPNLYVVGDYLFDSTLNGVMDSADTVAQLLLDLDLD